MTIQNAINENVVREWESIGFVGDLCVQYLVAIDHSGQKKVWVVGYCRNQAQNHSVDEEMNQSELFALVWRLVRWGVSAIVVQAKAYPDYP